MGSISTQGHNRPDFGIGPARERIPGSGFDLFRRSDPACAAGRCAVGSVPSPRSWVGDRYLCWCNGATHQRELHRRSPTTYALLHQELGASKNVLMCRIPAAWISSSDPSWGGRSVFGGLDADSCKPETCG